jgi:hypothetical protein
MRSIRTSIIAARRLLVASAAALTFAIGVVVTAPVASAGNPTGCSWQPLTLINGWQSEEPAYGTGDPSYCVMSNGMVYLSGSLAQPASGGAEFAVLPSADAPAHLVYLSVYTYADTVGILRIQPDGGMYAYSGSARQYTSLAGVSFPDANVSQQPMTLENGWQSAQGTYNTGDPSYFVAGGAVHLSGSADGGTGTMAHIPSIAWPTQCIEPMIYTYTGVVADVQVQPVTGEVNVGGGDSYYFASLAGVNYPAAPAAWQPLTLLNGWVSFVDDCVNGSVSYEVTGGVVYLDGDLYNAGTPTLFAVLPPEARPTHTLYLAVDAYGLTADLEIDPNGSMYMYHTPGYPDESISLSGLSFKTGS